MEVTESEWRRRDPTVPSQIWASSAGERRKKQREAKRRGRKEGERKEEEERRVPCGRKMRKGRKEKGNKGIRKKKGKKKKEREEEDRTVGIWKRRKGGKTEVYAGVLCNCWSAGCCLLLIGVVVIVEKTCDIVW